MKTGTKVITTVDNKAVFAEVVGISSSNMVQVELLHCVDGTPLGEVFQSISYALPMTYLTEVITEVITGVIHE